MSEKKNSYASVAMKDIRSATFQPKVQSSVRSETIDWAEDLVIANYEHGLVVENEPDSNIKSNIALNNLANAFFDNVSDMFDDSMADFAPSSFNSNLSGPSSKSNTTYLSKKVTLYKTEMCRTFEETGTCRYGYKCQFAHDPTELRAVSRHPRYKTEICKTFWQLGNCPYGKRCCFIHSEDEARDARAVSAIDELKASEVSTKSIGESPLKSKPEIVPIALPILEFDASLPLTQIDLGEIGLCGASFSFSSRSRPYLGTLHPANFGWMRIGSGLDEDEVDIARYDTEIEANGNGAVGIAMEEAISHLPSDMLRMMDF